MTREEMRSALEHASENPDARPGSRRGLVRRALAAVNDADVQEHLVAALVARALGREVED
jgi:hypothetical protein